MVSEFSHHDIDDDAASRQVGSATRAAADSRPTTVDVIGDRKKKSRTVFSRRQVRELETTFAVSQYLSSADRCRLAGRLQLTETQVKIWFQNRRNKWNRQQTTAHAHMVTSLGAPAVARDDSAWNSGIDDGISREPISDKYSRRPPGSDTTHHHLLSPAGTLSMYPSLSPTICPLSSLTAALPTTILYM